MKLCRQAIERLRQNEEVLPDPLKVLPPPKLPRGTAYLETEAPKGQIGFMLVGDGTPVPWRVRVRSSSFCNLSVSSELCRGCLIADVPAVIGSLDIVLGEIDR